MSLCSVIIPVHNRASLSRQCLDRLLANPPQRAEWEVIVVDDGSTDATQDVLRGYGARIRTIDHATNRGFAAACNRGAATALGEYLVFLNNDTLPAEGWLDALVRCMDESPRCAVAGSKLLYPNNTIQHAGVAICRDGYPRHLYLGFPPDHPAVNRSRRYQAVTGACMLVRRTLFEQIGGFDTGYHNGFEDIDLCLRLGEAGHEIHYCHESILYHLESVSPGRFQAEEANSRRFRRRWLHRVEPDDVDYYLADGLLSFTYGDAYPARMAISPLLAKVDGEVRRQETERLLNLRTQQVAGLLRENTRLLVQAWETELQTCTHLQAGVQRSAPALVGAADSDCCAGGARFQTPMESPAETRPCSEVDLHALLVDAHAQLWERDSEILAAIYRLQTELATLLGQRATESSLANVSPNPRIAPSEYAGYQAMIRRIRHVVDTVLPSGSTVAVISKGDDALVAFRNRQAWHFPQAENGEYAGHYPTDSAAAIAHLEAVRSKGAEFLLIPHAAWWWLEHYAELGRHLQSRYRQVTRQDDTCVIYALG